MPWLLANVCKDGAIHLGTGLLHAAQCASLTTKRISIAWCADGYGGRCGRWSQRCRLVAAAGRRYLGGAHPVPVAVQPPRHVVAPWIRRRCSGALVIMACWAGGCETEACCAGRGNEPEAQAPDGLGGLHFQRREVRLLLPHSEL